MECRLPDSVLLNIFSYFDKRELGVMAQVSWRWRRIAYDRSFWHILDLNAFWPSAHDIDQDTVLMLIKTRLAFALDSLNLGACSFTAKIAKELEKKCPNLKRLVIHSVEIVGDPTFGDSKQFPTSLELMDLRYCWGNFSFMKRLPRHFTQMKYIGLGAESSKYLVPDIFSKMHDLRVLDCTECDTITDAALQKISRTCPRLESICLNECKNFTGKSLGQVLKNSKLLSTLLMRFTKLVDSSLLAVNWEETNIKELDITGCYYITTTGLTTVLAKLSQLSYFKMNQCGFRHILNLLVYQEIRPQVSFSSLETLDLRWNFLLSADCLECILRLAPRLQYLGVSHSPRVGPATMAKLLPYLSKLKILEFGPLKKEPLSETNLVKCIVQHCIDIEAVSLINFTVNGPQDSVLLTELKQKCKKLQDVKLCNPRIEHVAVGSGGETITVERLLIKMESLLPSPEHTLGNVITKLLC